MKLSDTKKGYSFKLAAFSGEALFQSLDKDLQDFIHQFGSAYKLTYQELRQVSEIAIDLKMWGDISVVDRLNLITSRYPAGNGNSKKQILKELQDYWQTLKTKPSDYSSNAPKVKSVVRKVTDNTNDHEIFGPCPVASEKTVCCNLLTIDAVQGCSLGCSYCSIQTFYTDGAVAVESNLEEKLDQIELDPMKNYHIGSGQSSDSLAMGNRGGVLDAQLNFARKNPNIILEFKTKSKEVDYFLSRKLPPNIFVSWSLNPQVIIDHEEHFTASLKQRIGAARTIADAGIIVGFHFHPIVYYRGWKNDYLQVASMVMDQFSPDEVGMISLGTLTFIKPAIQNLRKLGIPSKVLQMPLSNAVGKYSYSLDIKKKIFDGVYKAFTAWHEKVFFYFCMEERILWQSVMGTCYSSNESFEDALFQSVSGKMK